MLDPTPKYHVETSDAHLQRIEADFAAYRRATDAKLADHHTELTQLRAEFRKLFVAVQHAGEPVIAPSVDDWIINE